jgi:peroxiredoxin Q/BCP
MGIAIGQPLPDRPLTTTEGGPASTGALLGRPWVLFFYPRANTPGCTREGQDFRDAAAAFDALGVRLLGASRDSLRTQTGFRTKHGFPFPLAADPEEDLCRTFDVIRLKKLYGREAPGVERSTFLLDAAGVLRREWRKVRVAGHVEQVLQAARELTSP